MKQLQNILSRSNIRHRWYVVVGCLALFVSLASLSSGRAFAATANPAMMTLKVTAYSDHGAMADGHLVYWGACAVYPPQFPFGTVIALYNSDGSFNRRCTAEDTGGAIGYGHIDLAMPGDEAGASNWGVRYLSAQVLRWGWGNGSIPQSVATSRTTATAQRGVSHSTVAQHAVRHRTIATAQREVSHSTVTQHAVRHRTIATHKLRHKTKLHHVRMHRRMARFAHYRLKHRIF